MGLSHGWPHSQPCIAFYSIHACDLISLYASCKRLTIPPPHIWSPFPKNQDKIFSYYDVCSAETHTSSAKVLVT